MDCSARRDSIPEPGEAERRIVVKRILQIAALAVTVGLVASCHGAGAEGTVYKSQDDGGRTLRLDYYPGWEAFFGRLHGRESIGRFTLSGGEAPDSGSFVLRESSQGSMPALVFKTSAGTTWEAAVQHDGSLTDEFGTVWRSEHPAMVWNMKAVP